MKQSELEKSAQRAAEELKKAAEANRKQQQPQARKHIENALKELQKHDNSGKEGQKQPQPSPDDKKQAKQEEKGASPRPGPGERPKQDFSAKNAEQLLELMGEEDKKLREALKQRRNMRRAQVEKDW